MKRIKRLVFNSILLIFSVVTMSIGIFAAASAPKVDVGGIITYDIGSVKVRVVGNLYGAYTDKDRSGEHPVEKLAVDNNNNLCHYYGLHNNSSSETNLLPDWNIGSVYFKELDNDVESLIV